MLYLGIRFDIDFNIGSFIIFISGVIFGLLIFGLLYLYFTLRTLKDKKYYVESELENTIKEEEIKEIISSYQEKYLNQRKNDNKEVTSRVVKEALYGVIIDIASKYFPDSKRPLLELSIDELIMLMRYITNRVDNLLGYRGIKILRKIKLSTIMNIVDASLKVNNTKVVQTTKKYKVGKIVKSSIGVLNILNPFYWIKKATTKLVTKSIYKKIILIIISIVGEETYKIYSKQALKEQDPKYIQMMSEIEEALGKTDSFEELEKEELDNFINELSIDEQEMLFTMEHKKHRKWWKNKSKEKITNK